MPSTLIEPLSYVSSKFTQRRSVVLPLPLVPTIDNTLLFGTSRSTPFSTRLVPNVLVSCLTLTNGSLTDVGKDAFAQHMKLADELERSPNRRHHARQATTTRQEVSAGGRRSPGWSSGGCRAWLPRHP